MNPTHVKLAADAVDGGGKGDTQRWIGHVHHQAKKWVSDEDVPAFVAAVTADLCARGFRVVR